MSSFYLPRHIEVGAGSLTKLGKIIRKQGACKPLIVIDSILAKPPLNVHEKIIGILQDEQIDPIFYRGISGEPNTDHVSAALDKLNQAEADIIVGIGGGSSIDVAKAVAVLALNDELQFNNIHNIEKNIDRLPLIAIPTTAGTGSEATKVMVITDKLTQKKMNPGSPSFIPDTAILEPELTLSLPKSFTAYTGLDALSHAIEAYVSTLANDLSDLYALESIRIISKHLPEVYANGSNLESRSQMLLASCYAGIAFSNSSTNLAHATARSLGAFFNIPHGLSVAIMLPFVMEFGLESALDRYAQIGIALGAAPSVSKEKLAKYSVQKIYDYNSTFNIWIDAKRLIGDLEKLKSSLPILINNALSGNGITTNRRTPTFNDIQNIFNKLIEYLERIRG